MLKLDKELHNGFKASRHSASISDFSLSGFGAKLPSDPFVYTKIDFKNVAFKGFKLIGETLFNSDQPKIIRKNSNIKSLVNKIMTGNISAFEELKQIKDIEPEDQDTINSYIIAELVQNITRKTCENKINKAEILFELNAVAKITTARIQASGKFEEYLSCSTDGTHTKDAFEELRINTEALNILLHQDNTFFQEAIEECLKVARKYVSLKFNDFRSIKFKKEALEIMRKHGHSFEDINTLQKVINNVDEVDEVKSEAANVVKVISKKLL